jgi:putative transposase
LHLVSKAVVENSKTSKRAIAFERLTNLRRLYRKGNGQGKNYRRRLNSWSFAEIKRQIEYKAKWAGIPIIELSVSQTRGTSQLCPQCGKRLQEDRLRQRELFCCKCNIWLDRDVVAAMNIARKGAEVFHRSKGLAGEAMVTEPGSVTPVICRVDASKFNRRGMSLFVEQRRKSRN